MCSLWDDFMQVRSNRLAQLSRSCRPTQVWCPYLSCCQHLLDGAHQISSCLLLTEMVEQKLARPDRGDRIGNTPACNVRCRAVNGLKEARVAPWRVEIRAGSQPQAAGDSGAQVGENIAKEVGGHNDIQALRSRDEAGCQRVDQLLFVHNAGEIRSHLPEHLVPED